MKKLKFLNQPIIAGAVILFFLFPAIVFTAENTNTPSRFFFHEKPTKIFKYRCDEEKTTFVREIYHSKTPCGKICITTQTERKYTALTMGEGRIVFYYRHQRADNEKEIPLNPLEWWLKIKEEAPDLYTFLNNQENNCYEVKESN